MSNTPTRHETPLAKWLRNATPDERERLAREAGTEVNYLYQIAACRREPKVGLAVRIALVTGEMHREHGDRLPHIDTTALATMCAIGGGA